MSKKLISKSRTRENELRSINLAIKSNPNDPMLWIEKGIILNSINDKQNALIAFDQAIFIKPNLFQAWVKKGDTLLALGKQEEALHAYDEALIINAMNSEVCFKKGKALLAIGNIEEALDVINKTIDLKANHAGAWHIKCIILLVSGRTEEAIEAYSKYLELTPNDADAWIVKGALLKDNHSYKEALSAFDKAIVINPKIPDVWLKRGEALLSLGTPEEAINNFDKAIELKNDLDDAWLKKAETLLSIDRFDEAIRTQDEYVKRNLTNRKGTLKSLQNDLSWLSLRENISSIKADLLKSKVRLKQNKNIAFKDFTASRREEMSLYINEASPIQIGEELEIRPFDRAKAHKKLKAKPLSTTRSLQCRIEDAEKGEIHRLFPAKPYNLYFRIGFPNEKYLSADKSFSNDLLKEYPPEISPEGDKGHSLRLVYYELADKPKTQISELFFPKEGNSKETAFSIDIPAETSEYKARIIVMYKNRALQTALFTAAMTETAGSETSSNFKLNIESSILNDLLGIDFKPQFDACLIFNHTEAGQPAVLGVTDTGAVHVPIEGSSQFVQGLNSLIEDFTARSSSSSFKSKATRDLLYKLAQAGNMIYFQVKEIFKDLGVNATSKDGFNNPKRIQVIEAPTGTYFPVEYFYNRAAPRTNSKICKYASQGLLIGECASQCPSDVKDYEIICPFAFWGFSVEIQRHKSQAALELKPDECILSFTKPGKNDSISPFEKAVFAASNKVDEVTSGSIKKIMDSIKNETNALKYIEKWKDWEADIGSFSPDSIFIIGHNEVIDGVPSLEIGEGDLFPLSWIEEEFLKGKDSTKKPMVALIGCSTVFARIPFQSFIPRLLSLGASAILATTTTISGSLVPEFMDVLVKEFHKACHDNDTFGHAVLRTRQTGLAKGQPLACVLASYGEANLV